MPTLSLEQELAAELIRRHGLSADAFVVEVGSGEGAFLKPLRERGLRVLGIEPDVRTMTKAWSEGVDTLSAHFGIGVAEYVRHRYGPARLVVSRSVRAGSEEFGRLVAGASRCLTPDGVLAIQSAGINAFVEIRPDPQEPVRRAA
ncbi:MAG TPA: methyltransferase domain-containing protein [Urbifossiella sp.]|jgi:SAM-dependent methyltransferase